MIFMLDYERGGYLVLFSFDGFGYYEHIHMKTKKKLQSLARSVIAHDNELAIHLHRGSIQSCSETRWQFLTSIGKLLGNAIAIFNFNRKAINFNLKAINFNRKASWLFDSFDYTTPTLIYSLYKYNIVFERLSCIIIGRIPRIYLKI